jgi:phosphoglycerate dehydrogenase-like enzyme
MSLKVVVLDDYQNVARSSADWSALTGRADVAVLTEHVTDEDELVRLLADAEVVVAMRERTAFPASLLARLPALRLLVTTGMMNASIDLAAAQSRDVVVCGTGGTAAGTPELTWALIGALMRNLPREDAGVRNGEWQLGVGRELAGSTLGLLGLGRIGQRVARYAHAFDMTVVAWSQNLTAGVAAEHGARLVSKAELFTEADVVSVHLKLSDRTRGFVGADELALLGPDGYLINTSRGPIVDEAALVDALRNQTIAGAGLDVYDVEPLPVGHALRSAPNTILTPHLGYVTTASYAVFYREVVEDIVAWLDDTPVRVLAAN